MKLTNEICISFLRGSGWLYNHDKEITISERNKAIDECIKIVKFYRDSLDGIEWAVRDIEELKAGGENVQKK